MFWDVWTPPLVTGGVARLDRLDGGGLRTYNEALAWCRDHGPGEFRVGSPEGRQVNVVVTLFFTRVTEVDVDDEFAED